MTSPTIRDEELGAALRALETPEHGPGFDAELRRRLDERPRRTRARLVAIAAVLAVAVAVPAVVLAQTLGSDEPRDWSAAIGDLPALPPGEPKSQAAGSSALTAHVSREDLLAPATRVFVGTVVAKGGSEFLYPPHDNLDFRPSVHRVRFSVERTLRGEHAPVLDLLILDGSMEFGDFKIGERVLVFTEIREFGERVPALTPHGYWQGVFRVRDDGTARNEATDTTFSLDELEAELQR
jgi:hypothetical protein